MFSTERVSAYLNNFTGVGDSDEKELRLTFYVTPITYELAKEVSPQLADRLFRNITGNGDWQPAQEMPKASFSAINIDAQNLTIYALPEAADSIDDGVLIPQAKIFNLRAQRAYPDKPDFRLEFDCVVPMDDTTMRLVERFFKGSCYLSTTPAQIEMFEDPPADANQVCGHCNERASWQDSEKEFLCQKHLRLGKGDVKLIVKKETPAEAEARAKAEADAKHGISTPPSPETSNGEEKPEAEDASFINSRNSRKRK